MWTRKDHADRSEFWGLRWSNRPPERYPGGFRINRRKAKAVSLEVWVICRITTAPSIAWEPVQYHLLIDWTLKITREWIPNYFAKRRVAGSPHEILRSHTNFISGLCSWLQNQSVSAHLGMRESRESERLRYENEIKRFQKDSYHMSTHQLKMRFHDILI
jgi:hypothetical protein